jgi:hypothetical protein
MTPDKILEKVIEKGQFPGMAVGNLRAAINNNTEKGGGYLRQGNTLFMYKMTDPKTLDFYCFSIDKPQKLAKNLEDVFSLFKKFGVKKAITPYDQEATKLAFDIIAEKFKVKILNEPAGVEIEVEL